MYNILDAVRHLGELKMIVGYARTSTVDQTAGLEAQERESSIGLFEGIAYQDYLSYGGTMNQKDFLSLPEEEQQEMIEMQKKCEKR